MKDWNVLITNCSQIATTYHISYNRPISLEFWKSGSSEHLTTNSIDIEVIRTVYYYFFIKMFLHKKTYKLYSNISIHLKSITSNFHLTSITKTSNFHLTSNSFRYKAINFCSNIDLKNIVYTKCNQ